MPYNTKRCKNADEFWDLIDPINPLGRGNEYSDKFVFRGQIDAEGWDLKPASLRKKTNPSFLADGDNYPTSEMQVINEWQIIKLFVEQCDITGISMPNNTQSDRERLFNEEEFLLKYSSDPSIWPSKDYYEILAFAQHHGLPTCLLDWTKRSHIAAYFASSEAITTNEVFNNIVVWVLDTTVFEENADIEQVQLPTAISVNLSAQFGLFTILHQEMERGERFIANSIENAVDDKYLTRIILDKKFACEILDYCDLYAVSAATLFPGVEGAVKATQDKLASKKNRTSYQESESLFEEIRYKDSSELLRGLE